MQWTRPKELSWRDAEDRGAVIPLIREVGRPDIAHASSYFDDEHRILWVGIWWAPGTPDYEKPLVLERCRAALEQWRGLRGYEARVVSAQHPYRAGAAVGCRSPGGGHRWRRGGPGTSQ